MPIGIVNHTGVLTGIMGCKVSSSLMKYPSHPLGASHKYKVIWDGVIENIGHRLAGWKMKYISNGGRITPFKEYVI